MKELNIDQKVLKSLSEAAQFHAVRLKQLIKPLQEVLFDYGQSFKNVPESIKELAEIGWYLPFDFLPSTINHFANELKNGKNELVDNEMISLIDFEIDKIEKELIYKFPNRESPIKAAIKAHKNQDYYLSIPVFFSQTEGICQDLTGYRFFSARNGEPQTKLWVDNFNCNSILELVLEPLRHKGVTMQKQEKDNPIGINRHDVLHGNSVDYGNNKINSYKALSLLNYIGESVYNAKQHLDNKI